VLAVVSLPALGEVFVASEGRGARFGKIGQRLEEFKPCFLRQDISFDKAVINSAPLDAYFKRGVDSWFGHLHKRRGRLRVQGDAFGYTRVLMGGTDAMIDPMVCDHDVAAIQVLFQETPGAFFSSLHGNTGHRAYARGGVVAAASAQLGVEILENYWKHLASCGADDCENETFHSFFENYSALENVRWAEENSYRQWCFAMEKAIAEFRLVNAGECIEDVAVVGEFSRTLQQRSKNGICDEPASIETSAGVQVRAVVAGGVGLVTSHLPEQQNKVLLVSRALNAALAHSHEQKMPFLVEILSSRPKSSGHFGNIAWGTLPRAEVFRGGVDAILEQQLKNARPEVHVIRGVLEQTAKHRFQLFMDGVRQTVSSASTLIRVSATATRDSEKRQGSSRDFSAELLSKESIDFQHKKAMDKSVSEAIDLLDAEYVPENVSYQYLAIDADLLGLILHEALGHAMEGDALQLGGSGLASGGRLKDVAVAPPWMNVVVDGNLKNCGYEPVDYEGTPALRKTLVREGKLVEAIHSRETAFAMGHVPDGCARAESVFVPSLNRMTSIWIQANSSHLLATSGHLGDREFGDPRELQQSLSEAGFLKNGGTVLYLTGWKGGSATCSNLEFRADVRKVYLIQEGVPPKLMRSANFTGIATACFQSAVAAFGEVTCNTFGICGKDEQSVPTSDGGPMILLLGKHDQVSVIGAGDGEQ
jgi:TldD protein